jgi:hypothetical protein
MVDMSTVVSSIESRYGIRISADALSSLVEELNVKDLDIKSFEKYFLESDFKQLDPSLYSPTLSDLSLAGKTLVQLGKVVDISRPVGPEDDEEGNEGAQKSANRPIPTSGKHRLLKINVFTIGGNKIEFLETEKVCDKLLSVPPGTKVLLKGPFRYMSGFYLINRPGQAEIIGGRVRRLADGWDMGNRVKEARQKGEGVIGPPKFVSFFDRKKFNQDSNKSASTSPTATVPTAPATVRTIAPEITISDKSATIGKLSSDTFAMKSRSKGSGVKREGKYARRREEDALIAQYKPPTISAPQLFDFAPSIAPIQPQHGHHGEVSNARSGDYLGRDGVRRNHTGGVKGGKGRKMHAGSDDRKTQENTVRGGPKGGGKGRGQPHKTSGREDGKPSRHKGGKGHSTTG